MIEMKTAYTLEVDDAEYALKEILDQLDLPNSLRNYSGAIMCFHSDYIETGVAQAIAEGLPFDCIGSTTLASMTPDGEDSLMLSVSLYTSDEVQFSSLLVIDPENQASVASAYDSIKLDAKASLVVTFVAMRIPVPHEEVLQVMDEVVNGAPIFGAVSIDHTPDLSTCFVIHNGEISQTGVVALLFWGDLDPVFSYSEMSKDSVQRQQAQVTKSEGKTIAEVNGASFRDFLVSVGFPETASAEELGGVPLIVDYGDGTTPIACGLQGITDDGWGIVGIAIPEGATLSIGSVERGDILRLTGKTLDETIGSGKRQGLILVPCASHYLVLGANAQDQKDIIVSRSKGLMPYHLTYAGGEICPAYDTQGKVHNRFHNYTFVACVF